MIIKSFEANKININKNNIILMYGKNEGLKKEITNNFILNKEDISSYEEKEIIELYKKGHNPTQIAEWIKTSSLKKENRPGVVRVLKKHKLIK